MTKVATESTPEAIPQSMIKVATESTPESTEELSPEPEYTDDTNVVSLIELGSQVVRRRNAVNDADASIFLELNDEETAALETEAETETETETEGQPKKLTKKPPKSKAENPDGSTPEEGGGEESGTEEGGGGSEGGGGGGSEGGGGGSEGGGGSLAEIKVKLGVSKKKEKSWIQMSSMNKTPMPH